MLLRLRVVVPAEQMVCAVGETVPVGAGFTVTAATTGVPVQPALVGVIV